MNQRSLSSVSQLMVLFAIAQVILSFPSDVPSDTRPSSSSDPATTEDSRPPVQPPSSGVASPSLRGPIESDVPRSEQPSSQEDGLAPRQGPKPPSQGQAAAGQSDTGSQQPGRPPVGPPPCRVVLLANGTELTSHPCPPDSNCTEPPPNGNLNPNREVDVFFCSPPPGLRFRFPAGGPPAPIQCRIVDKKTNESRLNVDCPLGTSCQVLDQRNQDDNIEIYLCTPPFQPGRGPVDVNDRRVPPCKVVEKKTGATIVSRDCPDGNSCTELDQRNPDTNVDIFQCVPSSQSQNRS